MEAAVLGLLVFPMPPPRPKCIFRQPSISSAYERPSNVELSCAAESKRTSQFVHWYRNFQVTAPGVNSNVLLDGNFIVVTQASSHLGEPRKVGEVIPPHDS